MEVIQQFIDELQKLPPAEKKEIILKTATDLPAEERKAVVIQAATGLDQKDREEVARSLQLPTQRMADVIWLIIIIALALVLLGSAGALVIFKYQSKEGGELLLSMFLAVLGYLAGLITRNPIGNR